MAANGYVKMEDDAYIKPDPEGMKSPSMMDEDVYEDTGELTMQANLSNSWITRVPDWLWEALSEANEDDEIEIGKLKVWERPEGQKLKIVFNDRLKSLKSVPKQYDLRITNPMPSNLYVFTEKDTGYNPNLYNRGRNRNRNYDNDALKPQGDNKIRKRRAIPKQTSLSARAQYEVSCVPVENNEWRKFIEIRNRPAPSEPTFLTDTGGDIDMTQNAFFNDFTGRDQKDKRKKAQADKATRMAPNDLIDLLVKQFREYAYWGMRELKQVTKQPESYLRSTLEGIGYMPRSGPFTNKWTLKDEYMRNLGIQRGDLNEEIAPDRQGEDVGKIESDDEDDDDMEGVI